MAVPPNAAVRNSFGMSEDFSRARVWIFTRRDCLSCSNPHPCRRLTSTETRAIQPPLVCNNGVADRLGFVVCDVVEHEQRSSSGEGHCRREDALLKELYTTDDLGHT